MRICQPTELPTPQDIPKDLLLFVIQKSLLSDFHEKTNPYGNLSSTEKGSLGSEDEGADSTWKIIVITM